MAKAICKFCSTEFEFSPAHKRVYCGRQCYENFLKNNGTRKGVKLSEETKTKIRLASLGEKNHRFGKKTTEETKKKISESNKGKHRYWKGKKQPVEMIAKRAEKLKIPCPYDKKQKISAANTGKKRTIKQRKAQAIRISDKIQNGWIPSHCSKNGKFASEKNGNHVHYRSSYELRAFEILEYDKNVIKYDVEVLRIPYLWDEIERIYVPDILVWHIDGHQEIIEIKAEWNTKNPRFIAKTQAAINYCQERNIKFSVWTEQELYG